MPNIRPISEPQQALISLYAKLAEAEEEIANGAEGEDFFEIAKQIYSTAQKSQSPAQTQVTGFSFPLKPIV